PLSQWLYSVLAEAGFPVICVLARRWGFSLLALESGTLKNKPSGLVPTAKGGSRTDVVVRNVCDRDCADPRRGGDRRLGSGGNSGGNDRSRRDGAVAGRASGSGPAPPGGLGSQAECFLGRA